MVIPKASKALAQYFEKPPNRAAIRPRTPVAALARAALGAQSRVIWSKPTASGNRPNLTPSAPVATSRAGARATRIARSSRPAVRPPDLPLA